jgi:hypothetical protein
MDKKITLFGTIAATFKIIPNSVKLLIQGFRKTQVGVKYLKDEEFRNFYKANKNGFINKDANLSTEKLKWLRLQEKAQKGKVDELLTTRIKKSKFIDKIVKKEIDIKPIGNITIEKNNKELQKILIGYNSKTNKMEVAINSHDGHRVWETLKDSKIQKAIQENIRSQKDPKSVKFNAKMFDLDKNQIPEENQTYFANKFDEIARNSFESSPVLKKNVTTLPDDFSENKENYLGKIFNVPAQKMNLKTNNDSPFVQMEYQGTDVGHHCFRPLYGMENNNKSLFINEARFNQIRKDQHIEVVSKFDKHIVLGLDNKNNTIQFGSAQGKNNSLVWQPATKFFSDETFSEERRSIARLKLVNQDYILEKGAIQLKNNQNNISIKYHANGALMFKENNNTRDLKKDFLPLKMKDAKRILNQYANSPNLKNIQNKLIKLSNNNPTENKISMEKPLVTTFKEKLKVIDQKVEEKVKDIAKEIIVGKIKNPIKPLKVIASEVALKKVRTKKIKR